MLPLGELSLRKVDFDRLVLSDNFIRLNKKYRIACRLMNRYFINKQVTPLYATKIYKKSLDKLRQFLDVNGVTFNIRK
jgi:hypothetical protein